MRLLELLAFTLLFTIFKGFVIEEVSEDTLEFPTFDAPDVEFADVSDGCGVFNETGCLEFIGNLIANIVKGVIWVVLFIVEIVTFVMALLLLIFTIQLAGFEDVPAWINVLILGLQGAAFAIIIYRMLRKGDDDA